MNANWPSVWTWVPWTYINGQPVWATWDAKRKVWVLPK